MSFGDSFLDFDAIKAWFEDNTNADMADGVKVEIGVNEADSCCKTGGQEHVSDGADLIGIGSKTLGDESGPIDCGSQDAGKVKGGECEMLENASCTIEDDMGKVSLVGISGKSDGMDESGTKGDAKEGNGVKCETVIDESGVKHGALGGNGVKGDLVVDEDESDSSESERVGALSSSSSSSSSSGSSDDDDVEEEEEDEDDEEEEMKVDVDRNIEAGEVEEGEIRDADGQDMANQTDDDDDDDDDVEGMVGWSDIDDADDEEDGGGATKEPITSKNEVKALPPVPTVDATLLPHHQMLPVGVVSSILGNQVIVEGIEKHSPLSDGSILWITESKSPLGLVDEIFGPVKHPYYIVRYNSESEVPAGVETGTLVAFVPEFASHVLNNKDIFKKGYDASGANDEEVSDEAEFSDDEKESEYKRMQKMTKRGANNQKPRNNKNNKKNVKNRGESWKNGKHSPQETLADVGPVQSNQQPHCFAPLPTAVDHGNCSNSFAAGQGLVGGAGLVSLLPPVAQTGGFNAPSNGVWANGMSFQQPQGALFPSGFPTNGMPWLSQNSHQYPFQMPIPNTLPFPQQVDPSQRLLSAAVFTGARPNALPGSQFPQGLVGQNPFNPVAFGIGLQGNVGEQVIISNGLPGGQNSNVPQSGGVSINIEAAQQFNLGASSHGRRPYHRVGGRFAGGRGRKQSG